ncbi:SAM-dependent methyltransferase [Levilactobacillus senmaizukei DSM 21775 = NBRC 103853]|uniref:SAM-dependent methyltransferase n=1 Tax=Levilactobacillus senmaizukei DSM 21775 = NBRC 103853 TaxID=1423803 RepID=A0A0R2DHZ2_9LACO|nr:methyltransferase domain-containing protein [Levilactobacillus senmaizukei]KRN03011.1 SAM-dependent methyltransferase [Levilactobacillus senmaizukei DSM 21775 = NBRC 103853]
MKKGIDAPLVPILFLLGGIVGVITAIISKDWTNYIFPIIFLLFGGLYLHTSLWGKYKIIRRVVREMDLSSEAQVLDLGTGHGAFLLEVAQQLKTPGKVIGLDIWNQGDQSGNAIEVTQRNVEQLGVSDVSELVTGNMVKLPFENNVFDRVVASLSIHNVKPRSSREKAIDEAYRVLKPEGQLVILDIEHVGEYRNRLTELGASAVRVEHAGINGMYAALSTRILIAKK